MVSNQQLMANAMGGKSARACDSCIRKRARWYCAADDAFLCQSCDSSVHSANPLARRHERVRLQVSSSIKSTDQQLLVRPPPPLNNNLFIPAWQRGMTKKPRTPRRYNGKKYWQQLPLVPETEETNSFDEGNNEEEEQMLYRVPEFDSEICTSMEEVSKSEFLGDNTMQHVGFLPSEMELAEFAADVETLLGNGLEDEPFDMEALGILTYKEKDSSLLVKVEDDNYEDDEDNGKIVLFDEEQDLDDLEISFDYDDTSPPAIFDDHEGGGDTKMEVKLEEEEMSKEMKKMKKNSMQKVLLRLDYEEVIKAWDDKKSPWTSGGRPELNSSTECWPDCMVSSKIKDKGRCGMVHQHQYPYHHHSGMMGGGGGRNGIAADEGREARVSRYREKRRTRLFSKKIRYEVRKLNAEKRPRMKGRFVKRSNFAATGPPTAAVTAFSINAS
ncbi:zinc finger protein CONSTANS-LIKE 16 [Impatiens glandulifera]|uniref:zinc finger protein CONSTANS-LIKE 16 n=1 Tax=Impatiens glandulifera TaxID=253017 RepID=UPI001FB0C3FA|nr:zinc finger protein CONSTANS-LIKE 16 [Impatiens glandulifera]